MTSEAGNVRDERQDTKTEREKREEVIYNMEMELGIKTIKTLFKFEHGK
jgi:hypothetical protein